MKRLVLSLLAAWLVLPGAARAWEHVNGSHPIWCDVPRIKMLSPGSADLGEATSAMEVQRAFDAWAEPSCSNFRYEYVGTTTEQGSRFDYDSLVYWDEITDWMSDAVGATTVHSSPENEGGNVCIRSSDIQLRALDRTWTTDGTMGGGDTLYTFNVLAHEVGHLIGLGHSPDTTALMYMYGKAAPQTLVDDDEDGVCALYGEGGSTQECETEGCPNDMFCRQKLCLSAGKRCGGAVTCAAKQKCTELNVFSYCLDECDFRDGNACDHPDRFCSPRLGDGQVGYCTAGKPGDLAEGAACAGDFRCASGMCENGICRAACSEQSECEAGTECSVSSGIGVCLPMLVPGEECESNAECMTGVCFDDEEQGTAYCSDTCDDENPCATSMKCEMGVCVATGKTDAGVDGPGSLPGADGGVASDAGADGGFVFHPGNENENEDEDAGKSRGPTANVRKPSDGGGCGCVVVGQARAPSLWPVSFMLTLMAALAWRSGRRRRLTPCSLRSSDTFHRPHTRRCPSRSRSASDRTA